MPSLHQDDARESVQHSSTCTRSNDQLARVDWLIHLLADLDGSLEIETHGQAKFLAQQIISAGNDYLQTLLEHENLMLLAQEHDAREQRLLSRLRQLIKLLERSHDYRKAAQSSSNHLLTPTVDAVAGFKKAFEEHNTPSDLGDANSEHIAGDTTCKPEPEPEPTVDTEDREPTEDIAKPSITVKTFGSFEFLIDGVDYSECANAKGKQLLKYLLTHRQRVTPKEELMDMLWPGHDAVSARNNLNVLVYGLRQAVKPALDAISLILFRDGGYTLNPALPLATDFEDFENAFQSALHSLSSNHPADALPYLKQAQSLYRGIFMDGDHYTEWLQSSRESYQQMYIQVLEAMDAAYTAEGELTARIDINQKILAVDSCHEGAHRRLMECYNQSGQRHMALRQYQVAEQTLERELDTVPGLELQNTVEQIRNQVPE